MHANQGQNKREGAKYFLCDCGVKSGSMGWDRGPRGERIQVTGFGSMRR